MKQFRENPRNEDVLSKTAVMLNKTIVAEIIESRGCDSGYKVGDKIYFDGGADSTEQDSTIFNSLGQSF
ncbi:MAG: hypothetical protein AB1502_01315 [Thermodesulfobacteriota bacterium]